MKRQEDGFILITVLLALFLLILIGTTLMLKSTSELKQVGNSQGQAQARAAAEGGQADMFYAVANPGLVVINNVLKPYADSFANSRANAATTPIIPPSAYAAILSSIKAQMPDLVTPATAGDPASSTASITFRTIRTDTAAYNATTAATQVQPYYIDYSIQAQGSLGSNTRKVATEGTLKILLGRTPLNLYILLANDGGGGITGQGGFLDGTSSYDGPVHVNKNLSLSGTPTFSAGLTVSSDHIYMNSNTDCTQGFNFTSVIGQQSSGCTVPNTAGNGIQYNTPNINLPTNADSQERASLGLDSTNTTAPTNNETCTAIAKPVPCANVPTGVYVPTSGGKPSGGIFIQGDGQAKLSVVAGKQIYTLTDSAGVITVVTVDYVAKTTVVVSGAKTTALAGVPNGQLYVSGKLTSLSGPTRTIPIPNPAPSESVPTQIPPAIASGSQLNIAAGQGVTVTGDITYQDDPRSVSTATNILGIISGTGNVNIGTAAPNDVYLQAAILTGVTDTGLGVDNYNQGGARGAIHLLGSLAEESDQLRGVVNQNGTAVAGFSDDLHFDRRFTNGTFAPPFFPTSTKFAVQTGFPLQRSWNEQ